ncbi:TniB family NTP-binding protein [Agarivorans gilvus]|uniref:Transposase n=1 Tax=Agarivorans gilvus TaxID=680279 RepID=A0ABQ1I643_9ALTE|nr:TniB family NTP-binding protein [Agarivorans gilvus]GGB15881.1 hypothetical protein GCM10007414_31680 [Agarivorans gilvus]
MAQLLEMQQSQFDSFLDCFIEHPTVTTIYEIFDRLRFHFHSHQRISAGAAADVPCMLLTGDSGSGKSSLVRHYRQQAQASPDSQLNVTPVLVTRIPDTPSLDLTILEMLSTLGHFGTSFRYKASNSLSLTASLLKALAYKKTELIIINEVQELFEFKSLKECTAISNRLKYISEESGIPFVLVGMPWADKITDDPQWDSRLIHKQFLPYFNLSSKSDLKEFSRLINGFCLRMGFDVPPKLNDKHTIRALFSACSGQMRSLKSLLSEALFLALKDRALTIELKHLEEAFIFQKPGVSNPFKMAFEEIPVPKVKEYSKLNHAASTLDEQIIRTQFVDGLPISQLLKKNS